MSLSFSSLARSLALALLFIFIILMYLLTNKCVVTIDGTNGYTTVTATVVLCCSKNKKKQLQRKLLVSTVMNVNKGHNIHIEWTHNKYCFQWYFPLFWLITFHSHTTEPHRMSQTLDFLCLVSHSVACSFVRSSSTCLTEVCMCMREYLSKLEDYTFVFYLIFVALLRFSFSIIIIAAWCCCCCCFCCNS